MSNHADSVSPSRLGTYTACPRRYEFNYDQDIETPDRTKRYLQQGRAMHTTIEHTCDTVGASTPPEAVRETALDAFPAAWADEVDRVEFASDAQHDYYRRQARAAMEAYFALDDGPGIEHARQSIDVERYLTCTHRGVPVHGYADNILRTDDGLHIIDYKRSLRGIISNYTADRLEPHLNDEQHEPGRVKSAMQAATYIEGVKPTEHYEPGMTVRFSFYGLLYSTEFHAGADGYTVTARGNDREITGIYDEHADTIWTLIETAYEGITDAAFTPEPWELIQEESCEDCAYQAMCPDYIATEVEF